MSPKFFSDTGRFLHHVLVKTSIPIGGRRWLTLLPAPGGCACGDRRDAQGTGSGSGRCLTLPRPRSAAAPEVPQDPSVISRVREAGLGRISALRHPLLFLEIAEGFWPPFKTTEKERTTLFLAEESGESRHALPGCVSQEDGPFPGRGPSVPPHPRSPR